MEKTQTSAETQSSGHTLNGRVLDPNSLNQAKTYDERLEELENRILDLEINLFNMLKDMVVCVEDEVKKRQKIDVKEEPETDEEEVDEVEEVEQAEIV